MITLRISTPCTPSAALLGTVLVSAMVAGGCSLASRPAEPAPPPSSTEIAALNAEADRLSALLGSRLKAELQAAIAAGGPPNAIAVCHERALPIASELGTESGWTLGRTSLRVRNPANAPDAWEQATLTNFATRIEAGEAPASLQAHTLVNGTDAQEFRYMKAIVTQDVCTVCHGTDVAPALALQIKRLYPDDQATGFRTGELRGAFTLSKTIK
jgi:hypothetical protein